MVRLGLLIPVASVTPSSPCTHLSTPGSNLEDTQEEDVLTQGGVMPTVSVQPPAPTAGAPGALPALLSARFVM